MSRFLGVLVGALFPPLGVFLAVGFGAAFWINLLLTLLFWFPGSIHALWVIAHTGNDGRRARDGDATFISLLLAFLLPPLGVFWKRGVFSLAFWLNLLLTAFFWFPGSIHALWVVCDD